MKKGSVWVVAVDMGYGHRRAAYPLRDIAHGGEVVIANNYKGIPAEDRKWWSNSRKGYEAISRLKPVPIVGDWIFEAMDEFQEIDPFYPRRDLGKPSLQLRQIYHSIKKGRGRHLIEKLAENPIPLVATFFTQAFQAEYFDYPGDIYLVVPDTDISRAWAPLEPKKTRIKYLAPNGRVMERLQLYGIPLQNIHLTGFPLPKELVGGVDPKIIRKDLADRICKLDPNGIFVEKYRKTLETHFGPSFCRVRPKRKLMVTFAVGGAGAQRKLGMDISKSLSHLIRRGEIQLTLVAGVRGGVAKYFETELKKLSLGKSLNKNLFILYKNDFNDYYKEFNALLRRTDILWTKPSELSFYTGLGLPIIIAPPIGSQEHFNFRWIQQVAGGVAQNKVAHTDEWLMDWVESGGLARMAWNGFIEAPTHGTYRIEDVLLGKEQRREPLPQIV